MFIYMNYSIEILFCIGKYYAQIQAVAFDLGVM